VNLSRGATDSHQEYAPAGNSNEELGDYPPQNVIRSASFDQSDIERLRGGEPSALEHFVNFFSPLLKLKLNSRLKTPQAVEDVRQETFARVLKVLSSGGFPLRPERLGAFVNTVCNNVLFDYYPSASRSQALEAESNQELPSSAQDLAPKNETKPQAQEIRQELTPADRLLLRRLLIENRNRDEVCREAGVDREYLRVLLRRARKAFKKAYPDVGRKRA
jgi:RNA polymerase sigma-70 factor (ECF subfamily)